MAWCPRCKSEYVEGIRVCADCGCELVESLTKEEALTSEESEITVKLGAVHVQPRILSHVAAAIQESRSKEAEETEEFSFDEEEVSSPQPFYINNEERAEENRTSAYTLLTVGGAGLVLIVLFFMGIIDLPVSHTNKYMITGVMGVLFLLFIVMGIVSMKNSRILKKKACKENNLTIEIKKWCLENFNREQIDELLELEEVQTELKYFQRTDYMKKMIQRQFLNLDNGYLNRLIEEVYPEIFEVSQE